MVQSKTTAHVVITSVVVMVIVITCCGQTDGQTITSCVYDESSCGCKTEEGLVSLKFFEQDGLVTPSTPGGGTFLWNPCKDFTKDNVTAACIQHFEPHAYYDCGTHATTLTSARDGKPLFQMESMDDRRKSRVTCECSSAEKLNFISEEPTGVYNLDLVSKHCCPGYADRDRKTKYISAGSITLIVFSCLVFIYFIGGVTVRCTVLHAKGRDRIPHVEFWSSLLGLIADGCRFTFRCKEPLDSDYRWY